MSRRGARRNAFYLLFQMDFSEAEEFEQVKELFFAEKEEPVEEEDKEFILSEVEGVHAHMAEIDEMIRARGSVLQRSSGLRRNSSLLQHTPSCAYTFASLSL